jgi:hypothetical protein
LVCQQSKLLAQGELEFCLKANSDPTNDQARRSAAECWNRFTAELKQIDKVADIAGTKCRYIDNGDGTVSDLNTGLMWEQTTGTVSGPNTGKINDVNNSYTWSRTGTAPDGTAFTSFLATLNNGASTDGGAPITGCFAHHCDWRLPSIVELQGLFDRSSVIGCGGGPTCIDPILGPTHWRAYWSATTVHGDPRYAWDMDFVNNYVRHLVKLADGYTRAVRGGL